MFIVNVNMSVELLIVSMKTLMMNESEDVHYECGSEATTTRKNN